MRALLDWLDERTGWRQVLRAALDEPVPGGASWAYVFGSVLVFLLVLQAGTGVLLAFYYSPSVAAAWASVAYVQTEVTLGWLVRGLHAHGASAMVIVAGLHLLQVAVYGAYRRPREVNWIVGVLLLGLLFAFALTGYLLPWDQKGYWATQVATGILGSTPLVGGALQKLVQGGNEYGNLTLTRFFAIHVFVLPATAFTLVALHLWLFRRHKVTPRWGQSDAELARKAQPLWPDQLFRDMVAIAAAFAVLFGATVATRGVPLGAPADPASSYDARPEWYFLPLFQLLKYFHGPLEQVAALGAPLLVALFLLGLPFADRGPDRSPWRRLPFLGTLVAGFAAAFALMALAIRDDATDPTLAARRAAERERADKALALARLGVPPAGGVAVFDHEPHVGARRIWAERCAGCHEGPERKGPEIGPGYNSRAWIRDFLLDPGGPRFFGPTKDLHTMKPTEYRGPDLDAIVELVYAQTGAPDADGALARKGQALFDAGPCIDCHSIDGTTFDDEGPNLGGRGSREWLVGFIADPGHERFFGKKNEMTAFKDRLTPEEIGKLADWLVSLREASWTASARP